MTAIRIFAFIAALVAVFGARIALGEEASTIRLRESAVVPQGQPAQLSDVADLSGPLALEHAGLVVVSADRRARGASVDVTLDDIRRTLAGVKFNPGRVALHGAVCRVFAPAPPPEPCTEPMLTSSTPPPPSGPTIRDRLSVVLASHLAAAPEDIELRTDPADAPLLDAPVGERRIEVAPEASAQSPRIPVRIRIYDAGLITVDRSVRVDVRVRSVCVVAAAPIRKGQTIEESMVALAPVWRAPGLAVAVDPREVAGRKSLSRIEAGDVLTPDMVRSPVVVRRNELVQVRCLSGGIVLTAQARSGGDAAIGDMVELKLEGANRTFRGRIVGPASAVVDLDQAVQAESSGPAPQLLNESASTPRSRR